MPRSRQLLALLLAVLYVSVSTFGMAFVVCLEADGSRNVEPVGADCCVVAKIEVGADESSFSDPEEGDCGDCQDHERAIDLEPTKLEEAQSPLPATVVLPPPALPMLVAHLSAVLARAAFGASPPHPPPSTTAMCLRTVVLRS